jgi:hypothetical protein
MLNRRSNDSTISIACNELLPATTGVIRGAMHAERTENFGHLIVNVSVDRSLPRTGRPASASTRFDRLVRAGAEAPASA